MKTLLGLATLIAATVFTTCSDNPVNPNDSRLVVSGVVTVWVCPGWSPIYNYTEYTGKPATVTLTGSDGIAHIVRTDAHSRFSLSLDSGLYSITVSTFHMEPRSYGLINVERDTSAITYRTSYSYSPPDSMQATFFYPTFDTANAEQLERETLAYLSDLMHGVIDIRHATRRLHESNGLWVYYDHIVVRVDVPAWRARLIADEIIQNNSSHVPAGFSLLPHYIICMG